MQGRLYKYFVIFWATLSVKLYVQSMRQHRQLSNIIWFHIAATSGILRIAALPPPCRTFILNVETDGQGQQGGHRAHAIKGDWTSPIPSTSCSHKPSQRLPGARSGGGGMGNTARDSERSARTSDPTLGCFISVAVPGQPDFFLPNPEHWKPDCASPF